jgi:hypothetical protein
MAGMRQHKKHETREKNDIMLFICPPACNIRDTIVPHQKDGCHRNKLYGSTLKTMLTAANVINIPAFLKREAWNIRAGLVAKYGTGCCSSPALIMIGPDAYHLHSVICASWQD